MRDLRSVFWVLSLGRVVHTIAPMMINTTAVPASMAIMIAKCLMKVRSEGVRCVLTCELRLEVERRPRAPWPPHIRASIASRPCGTKFARVDLS